MSKHKFGKAVGSYIGNGSKDYARAAASSGQHSDANSDHIRLLNERLKQLKKAGKKGSRGYKKLHAEHKRLTTKPHHIDMGKWKSVAAMYEHGEYNLSHKAKTNWGRASLGATGGAIGAQMLHSDRRRAKGKISKNRQNAEWVGGGTGYLGGLIAGGFVGHAAGIQANNMSKRGRRGAPGHGMNAGAIIGGYAGQYAGNKLVSKIGTGKKKEHPAAGPMYYNRRTSKGKISRVKNSRRRKG